MAMAALDEMPAELPEELRERVSYLDFGPVHYIILDLHESNATPEVWERQLRDALRVIDQAGEAVAGAAEGFDYDTKDRIRGVMGAIGVGMCAHERPTRECTSCAVRYTLQSCRDAALRGFESLGTRIAEASLAATVRGRQGPDAKKRKNAATLAADALDAGTYAEFMEKKGQQDSEKEAAAFRWLGAQLDALVEAKDEDGGPVLGEWFAAVEVGDAHWKSGDGAGSFTLIRENGSEKRLPARSLVEKLRAKRK